MAETVTAPAAVTPTTPAPGAPASPPLAGSPVFRKAARASDYLAEAAQEAGTGGTGEVRQDDAGQGPAKPAPAPEDSQVESRITKLAGERRRVDEDKAALKREREQFAAEQTEALQHAGTMRKFAALRDEANALAGQEGKAGEAQAKALQALKLLGWSQEQLDTVVYNGLARDILAREPGEALTRKDVEELTEARIKAEREAEAKRAEEAETKRNATAWENFHAGVDASFDPAKFPALAKRPVTRGEVQNFVNEHFGKEQEVPTPEQIHQHFDKQRREEARAILFAATGQQPPADPGLPAMVGDSMRSTTLPDGRDYSKLSRKERWEIDKREAGIT